MIKRSDRSWLVILTVLNALVLLDFLRICLGMRVPEQADSFSSGRAALLQFCVSILNIAGIMAIDFHGSSDGHPVLPAPPKAGLIFWSTVLVLCCVLPHSCPPSWSRSLPELPTALITAIYFFYRLFIGLYKWAERRGHGPDRR